MTVISLVVGKGVKTFFLNSTINGQESLSIPSGERFRDMTSPLEQTHMTENITIPQSSDTNGMSIVFEATN